MTDGDLYIDAFMYVCIGMLSTFCDEGIVIQQHHTQLTQIDICALEDLLEYYYFMEILQFKIDKRK